MASASRGGLLQSVERLIYKAFALTSPGRWTIIPGLFPNVPDLSGPSLRPHFLSVLVAGLSGLASTLAFAALPRPIPDAAPRVKMAFTSPGVVQVKDATLLLSPGAQIRDTHNRIVLPSHVSGEQVVRMLVDRNGQVHRVWMLTPEEALAPLPKPAR